MSLEKLIIGLRREKCPRGVRARVAERIAMTADAEGRLRVSGALGGPLGTAGPTFVRALVVVGAVAACVAVGIGVSHLLPMWNVASGSMAAKNLKGAERARVREEAREAFGYVAAALMRAGAQSEKAILKEAVPPLRNGFETAKNKVSKPI